MLKDDERFVDSLSFSAYEKPSMIANLLFLAIIFFLGLMLIWITVSPIDEIVKGQGKVIPTSRIQNLQSVDGGIIKKILVRDGELVKVGQELMIIDDIRFNASVNEFKNELFSLKVKLMRLKLQSTIKDIKNIPSLNYPELLKIKVPEYIKNEKIFFVNQINELKSAISVSISRYKQKKQEFSEIKRRILKLQDNKNYLRKKLIIIKKAVSDGVMSKIDELNLKKELSDIKGEIEISSLSLKRSKLSIKESYDEINQHLDIFKSKSSNELSKIESAVKKIESKLIYSNDKVKKSIIYAPVNGIVNHIYFTTIGGVVKEADLLMDIVPTDDSLLIEAKIDPRDIGFISPDKEVIVKVTAYDFSIYGGLEGKIKYIGSDSLFDEKSKKYYYTVLVRTERNYLGKKEEPFTIIPGMIAEIDIKTGKKTILEYLLKPLVKTLNESMTER